MEKFLKLSVLFLLLTMCVPIDLIAQESKKEINMEIKDERLPQVLRRLEKVSGYKFLFTNDDLNQFTVTATVKTKSISKALDLIIGNKPIEYVMKDGYISIMLKEQAKRVAQTSRPSREGEKISISGKVVDASGQPLPGVAVQIEGTTWGAISDVDGRFDMPSHNLDVAVLLVSFVGMKDQKVLWNGKSLDIVLVEDVAAIDEVVVTGIFAKAKESYTGSVSSVTEEQLDIYRGQNLLQTLKNIDASINFSIDNINGSNPNNLPSINIRGNASLPTDLQEFNETQKNTVNTPLVIMDGFEITLEKLMDYNDDEIKSINILKDAASTAIYGSRGANGVIVIVTKEPNPGKLRVNAEIGMTFEVPDLTSYNLLGAKEKLALEKEAGLFIQADGDPAQQAKLDERYNRRLKKVLSGTDTDWLSKPLRTGVGQKYNLRLEGGSEQFRWSATASYTNTQGAMKDSERRMFNGSITLMYRVKDLIFRNYSSVGLNRSRESKYGTFSDYARLMPYESPYDADGNLVKSWSDYYISINEHVGNPLYNASLGSFDKSDYQTYTNNFSIEWKPIEEIIIRGQLGLSSTQSGSDKFVSPYNSLFDSNIYTTDEGMFRKGTYDYSTGNSFNYDANLTAAYSKLFKDVHQVYVGLDFSASQGKTKNYYFAMEGFDSENINNLTAAQQYALGTRPSGSYNLYRRVGVTANANYMFDNRYYMDLSYRIDGNSNFGSEKKYAPFWSVGLGWSLHNEKFLKGHEIISNLRLKASYGQTGTQLTSSTGAMSVYRYQQGNKYLNWSSAILQGLGNKNLTWQTTDEFNVGVEFGLWQNRVKGSFDYYIKETSDLLSYMNLPYSMGFTSYLANVGSVKNTGFESSLSVYIIRDTKRGFNWMLSGQLMYNKNEITELSADIQAQNEAYLSDPENNVEIANLFYEGYPQNAIYGVRSLGIDPSTGEELFLDKDGKVTTEWRTKDMVYLGQTDPKFRGVFSSLITWKGFTFNLSFGYRWGGQMYNYTLRDRVEVSRDVINNQNVDKRVYSDRWLQVGDVVAFKKISDETTKASSRYVMDDNVLELQSVSLQYRWDSDWLKKNIKLQSVTFGVNMSDVFQFSSVKVERGTSYPFARNIQGSVKLMF